MKRDIIGIFLGKNKILAASVNKRKEYRQIGFQGDVEYLYQCTADIDGCIACLENTYNVDTLSELDANFYIVDCGADLSSKNYLLRKIQDCRRTSSVFVDDLLYVLTGHKKLIKPGCKIQLDFLDKDTYVCDASYQWIIDENKSSGELIMLDDLLRLFVFDVNDLQYDDTELKQKMTEERQALEDEIKSLSKRLEESLMINNNYRKREIQKLSKLLSILSKRTFIEVDYKLTAGKLKIKKETGCIVSQGDTIACIVKKNCQRTRNYSVFYNNNTHGIVYDHTNGVVYNYANDVVVQMIHANSSGKIAWLFPTEGDIRSLILNHKEYIGKKIPVAVIGDSNDKEKDMIDWGRTKSNMIFQ